LEEEKSGATDEISDPERIRDCQQQPGKGKGEPPLDRELRSAHRNFNQPNFPNQTERRTQHLGELQEVLEKRPSAIGPSDLVRTPPPTNKPRNSRAQIKEALNEHPELLQRGLLRQDPRPATSTPTRNRSLPLAKERTRTHLTDEPRQETSPEVLPRIKIHPAELPAVAVRERNTSCRRSGAASAIQAWTTAPTPNSQQK